MQERKQNEITDLHGRFSCRVCHETRQCTEGIPFLAALSAEKQTRIINHALHTVYQSGEYLFHENEVMDGIYVIHSGSVKLVTYDAEGNEEIASILSDGDVMIEPLFSNQKRFYYSAIALRPSRVCKIFRRDLEHEIDSRESALELIRLLNAKLTESRQENLLLSNRSQMGRVAGFLLYMSKKSLSREVTVKLGDIGASLGMRHETVSRRINDLIADHIVTKAGQSTIRILDFERLRGIADQRQ
jgi:CRP-like cAMP-binding protein